jgi:hypothetical protein
MKRQYEMRCEACGPVTECGCVRTKTVYVRTEFKYNTQDDDSLSQSLSLPYNSSKMSLHYVIFMHCGTFSY